MFEANNRGVPQSQLRVLSLLEVGERVATQQLADPSFAADCADANTCFDAQILPLAERLWRGPLDEQESELLRALLQDAAQPLSENIQVVLSTLFASPRFYYKHLRARDTHAPSALELAHRLSFMLIDSVPDDVLYDAAMSGELVSVKDLLPHVDRLLRNAHFAQRFSERTVGAWLQFEADFESDLEIQMPGGTTSTLADVLSPLVDGVRRSVMYDLPLGTLFDDTLDVAWLQSRYFAHVTTHEDETVVTDRGLFVARKLLCLPIPINELDPEVVAAALGPNAGELNQLEVSEIRLQTPACVGCHADADKFGVALEHIDPMGTFRTHYADGTPITFSFDFQGTPVSDFTSFVDAFASDPRLETCFARTLATKVAPGIRSQSLACLGESGLAHGVGLREVVKHVVRSAMFTQDAALSSEPALPESSKR